MKVKFIPAEISESNERQRGKTLCLKLMDFLDEHLIICVDSDFDKFLRPGLLDSSKHILQTHAYSWENHHCQNINLQRKWEELAVDSFSFSSFLLSFSKILYPVLIKLLTAKSLGVKGWRLETLCSTILNVKVNKKGMLDENGKLLLQTIGAEIEAWSAQQQLLQDDECAKMYSKASDIGMTMDTAYLYMQGHCVYDLVVRIGNALCNGKHNFMYEVLAPAYTCSGYGEIESVKADILKLL